MFITAIYCILSSRRQMWYALKPDIIIVVLPTSQKAIFLPFTKLKLVGVFQTV